MTTTATTTHADSAPTTTPPELTPAGSSTATTTGRTTTTTHKRGHFAAIPNEIADVYGPRIGAVAGFVYYLIARHARAGKCWPTVETLAREGGLSEKTVKVKLRTLQRERLIDIELGGREAVKRNGKMTRANVYTLLPVGAPKGVTATPSKGVTITPTRGQPLPPNKTKDNKTHHQQAKHPPKIATGGPVFGGGGADSNLAQDPENIMRALMAACGMSRAPHTETLAAKIAAFPYALEVIEAEYAAVKGKSRNEAGALYSRLNNMTAADWSNRAPKARPVVRMKEIHE